MNRSYWESSQFYSGFDVLIIGSGIVGLSCALQLKLRAPSLKIAVLEAGNLPAGASTKNAGFACFGSISELMELLAESSEEKVREFVDLRWKGLRLLRETLSDSAIVFEPVGGFELFRSAEREKAESCIERLSFFNKLLADVIGGSEIYRTAPSKISEFGLSDVSALIENKFEGQLNSGKMMSALISRVCGLGVQLHTGTRVQSWQVSGSAYCLQTSQGEFECRRIMLATNAFCTELYPNLPVVPGRGQVLVTSPIEGLSLRGTFHYDSGYYYFRAVDRRVLIGGGRNLDFRGEETTEFATTPKIQHSLEELLRTVVLKGRNFEVAQRWSGIMAFGDSLEPIVRQLEPGIFCAVKCSGMGVALGSLTGAQAASLVLEGL